jgi:hypothetical protein
MSGSNAILVKVPASFTGFHPSLKLTSSRHRVTDINRLAGCGIPSPTSIRELPCFQPAGENFGNRKSIIERIHWQYGARANVCRRTPCACGYNAGKKHNGIGTVCFCIEKYITRLINYGQNWNYWPRICWAAAGS